MKSTAWDFQVARLWQRWFLKRLISLKTPHHYIQFFNCHIFQSYDGMVMDVLVSFLSEQDTLQIRLWGGLHKSPEEISLTYSYLLNRFVTRDCLVLHLYLCSIYNIVFVYATKYFFFCFLDIWETNCANILISITLINRV